MDKHSYNEKHIRALKFYVNQQLTPPLNFNLIEVLTEFCSKNNKNNNLTSQSSGNVQSKSIDELSSLKIIILIKYN